MMIHAWTTRKGTSQSSQLMYATHHLKQQRELVESMMWKGEGEFQNKKI